MDSAGLLFVCLTQRFSICQLCVWICVLGCDRGVSRLHRPWWIGHCVSVHVCVCVVSCNICTLVFSSTQKRSESECWSFFSSLSPPTKHTNTHFGACAGHRSVTMPTLSPCEWCNSPELLVHLPDVPFPVMPMDHHQPFGDSHQPTSGNLLSLQTRDHD